MTKKELQTQLSEMGLRPDDTLLMHSSMKAIGDVEGGADTVLDALMEYFSDGLLLLPTHTWASINADIPVAWRICASRMPSRYWGMF